MTNNKLSTRNYLELNGKLIYLKKLSNEQLNEYWEDLSNSCIESNILTVTSQVFTKSDIESFIDDITSDRNRIDFIIYSKETNKIIGEVVINDIYRNYRSANLRVAINSKDNFSKGYGSEALVLALNYGFGMLNLHRIELEVISFNERAIHVYEKIGFKREGIKRDGCYFNHQYYDLITMSILENEFRKKYLNNTEKLEAIINVIV